MAAMVVATVAALMLLAGCAGDAGRFPGSSRSVEELAETAVVGLSLGDSVALERIRLSEREHNDVVWPELPAARGNSPFPVDMAWRNIQIRNRRALGRVSSWFERRDGIRFVSVECRGEEEVLTTYHVMTDCYIRFEASGVEYEGQIFRDVIVRNGGYKIFRYYDEDMTRLAESPARPAQ